MTQFCPTCHDSTYSQPPSASVPWKPITNRTSLFRLAKLCEELGELTAAASRTILQGIDGIEPKTGKTNKQKMEEEIADVMLGIKLTAEHFNLDADAIDQRMQMKEPYLRYWAAEGDVI